MCCDKSEGRAGVPRSAARSPSSRRGSSILDMAGWHMQTVPQAPDTFRRICGVQPRMFPSRSGDQTRSVIPVAKPLAWTCKMHSSGLGPSIRSIFDQSAA